MSKAGHWRSWRKKFQILYSEEESREGRTQEVLNNKNTTDTSKGKSTSFKHNVFKALGKTGLEAENPEPDFSLKDRGRAVEKSQVLSILG